MIVRLGKLQRLHNLIKDDKAYKICAIVIGVRNPNSDPNDPKRTALDNPKFWFTVETAISGSPAGSEDISLKIVSTMNMAALSGQGLYIGQIDEAGLYAYDDGDFSGIDIYNTPVTGFLNLTPAPTLFAYSVISPPISWSSGLDATVLFEWLFVSA
jgi:hypothetical protein